MKIIKFLKLLRFDWIHFLGILILGYVYNLKSAHFFSKQLFSIILIGSLDLFHVYSLNDCFDLYWKTTKSEVTYFKPYIIVSYIILVTNVIFSFFFAKYSTIIILLGAIITYIYSAPPLRLKSKPFINTFLNSIGFSILFFIGFPLSKERLTESAIFFIFFMFIMTPIQLIHELSHFNEDKRKNILTTSVFCGEDFSLHTIISSLVLGFFWVILMWMVNICQFYFIIASFFFVSFFICYVIKKYKTKQLIDNHKIKNTIRGLSILYGAITLILFL